MGVRAFVTLAVVAAVGCGDDSSPAVDGGGVDASRLDATTGEDAGLDGGTADGAVMDATVPPLPNWARRYGTFTSDNVGFDQPVDATQTVDRDYVVAMSSRWVLGLDSDGEPRWDWSLPGVRPRGTGALPGGGVVLLANEDSADSSSFFRIVLSADGNIVTRTRYTSAADQRSFVQGSVSFRADGTVFAFGFLRQLSTDRDALPWYVSIAADGTVAWEQRLTSGNVYPTAIATRASGGIAFGGYDFEPDAWVAAVDDTGAIAWSRSFGRASSTERVVDLAPRPDGGWIVLADTDGFGAGDVDVWVVALDRDGAIEWQRTYGSPAEDRAATVAARADGYTFSGRRDGRAWLVGLAADGSVQWERIHEPPDAVVRGVAAIATDDGGALVTATVAAIDSFLAPSDVWALHVDAQGLAAGCAVVQTPTPSATSSTDATATDVTVDLERLTPHAAAEEPMAPEAVQSYLDVHCGPGEGTPWGDAAFLEPCTCAAGALCVGPTSGCGYGLTCVGRTGSARCSVRCGTDVNCPGSRCTIISVGSTHLGGWCQ
jgi:hypothetical protein